MFQLTQYKIWLNKHTWLPTGIFEGQKSRLWPFPWTAVKNTAITAVHPTQWHWQSRLI